MPTDPAHVCLSGKTGSERRAVRVARLTHMRHRTYYFLFASVASDAFVWLTRRNRLYAARKHVRCRNASSVPTLRCGGLCFVFLEVLILGRPFRKAVMGYAFAYPAGLKRSL